MAYVDNQNDPLTAQAAPGSGTSGQVPPQTSAGTGGTSGFTGASSPQGAASVTSTAKAPPVQDLHAYLAANAPQAVQAGQNIGNNLSAQANKVTGDINSDQGAFGQSVQAQNTAPNSDLVNQAALNPSAFVQDPNNVTAFQQQRDAAYTGPQTYESSGNYQGLQNEVTNAVDNAPDINQPGGITQLVTGQEKNPTVGKQNLDSLLLQENPDALAPIKSALAQYPNLQGYLTNAGQTQDAAIQQAIANDSAAQQGVQSRFLTGPNAAVPAWEQQLQGTLSNDVNTANTYNQGIGNLVSSENAANPEISAVMDALGTYNTAANGYSQADPAFGATSTLPQINGINLQDFNNPSTISAPTLAQAATPQDAAIEKAYEQLLGSSYTPYLTDTSQAGSFQNPGAAPTLGSLLSGKLDALGTDLTGAENDFTANGRLTPQGTPTGSVVNQNLVPAGDVLVNGSLPAGAHDPVFLPGFGTSGLFRGEVAQTGNTNFAGTPQYISAQAPKTGQQSLQNVPQGTTNLFGNPLYTSKQELPALQQAYQSLKDYLAAHG
jgi:hypothetical protein